MDRRSLLTGVLAGIGSTALAAPPLVSVRPSPRPDWIVSQAGSRTVDAIIARAGLSGRVACALADVDSGALIHGTQHEVPLPLASVAKALTALYALDTLRPDFRFTTQVAATGHLRDGRLEGDLVLLGSGDPTLDTDALANIAAQVRAVGIKVVTGQLLVWAGALPTLKEIDSSQPVHVGYNPAISGMNLNFNRVYFEWKPLGDQYALSMDARGEKLRPAVDVVRMRLARRDLPIYTHKIANGREEWTVAQTALGNKGGGRWLPVRQPALYAGDVMEQVLAAQGIRVQGVRVVRTPPQGQLIAGHQSAPLPELVRGMMRYSTNLTAEALGLTATVHSGASVQSLRKSAARMNDWTAMAMGARNPKLRDHSGLDGRSELTVGDMARMLVSMPAQASLPPLMKEIEPTKEALAAGAPTTMEIRAKTGTLNFVSTLAGYLDVPGARPRAFAIFCADVPRRNGLSRAERERPPGGRAWQKRARALQMALLTHWAQPRG